MYKKYDDIRLIVRKSAKIKTAKPTASKSINIVPNTAPCSDSLGVYDSVNESMATAKKKL